MTETSPYSIGPMYIRTSTSKQPSLYSLSLKHVHYHSTTEAIASRLEAIAIGLFLEK